MFRKTIFASLLASSAITLAIATPAAANKQADRAREAIAAAEAKIHTAETLGSATDAPRDTAGARAALASAKEDFASGHKEPAIQEAIQASALADTAIGISQKHKDEALAAGREARDQARDQAAANQGQAAAAQDQAAAARQQAADANARADAAQQSAAASAADAAAARTAAAMTAAQTPPPPPPAAQVETTVTTQHATNGHYHVVHTKVIQHPATTSTAPISSSDTTTTTTRVTPQ